MTKQILKNCRIFAGGVDLTSNANQVELKVAAEAKKTTSFGSGGWEESLIGLYEADISAGGQWEAGDMTKVDDALFDQLGDGVLAPWSILPGDTAVAGDLAYVSNELLSSYTLLDAVGEVAPWKADAKGTGAVVRGALLHPPGTARTTTGSGTAIQVGALSATQALYVGFHVLSVSGGTPSMTVKIQSDNAVGFPSSADQATFSAANTSGTFQVAKINGAVTDDWWRAQWTISGTTPSFLFVIAAGIGPA